MTIKASGTFEVKMSPLELHNQAEVTTLGRLALDKEFNGDLQASSHGEMLTGGNPASGSAGYVAIELVNGTLHGRSGTFILQHNGVMAKGAGDLTVIVVPDSGTGELTGLSGKLTITQESGQHFYALEYDLA